LGISEFEFRISEFQKKTDRKLRVVIFEADEKVQLQIDNPNSAIRNLPDLAGLPKAGEAAPLTAVPFSSLLRHQTSYKTKLTQFLYPHQQASESDVADFYFCRWALTAFTPGPRRWAISRPI
jgi:hypothetical protein